MNNKETDSSQRTVEVARRSLLEALRLSFNILKLVMVLVLVLFLTSGIFIVEQQEAGIVFRFGKLVGKVLMPGLHWAWPFPIDEHITIPAARVHTMEISFMPTGWERTEEGREKVSEKLRPGLDRYCLTGDANIIHSRWLIRYRINEPIVYVTGAEEPEEILKVFAENAVIRETSGFGVDEALRTNVDELRRSVRRGIEAELETTDIGLALEGVDVKGVLPPAQARDAFNSVIRAEQEGSRKINEAAGFENRIVNEAKGEATRTISEAETYKTRIASEAKADSEYLRRLLKEYPGEPEMLTVYLNQLYQEVMGEVLSGVEERFIIRKGKGEQEIRYIIGPEKGKR